MNGTYTRRLPLEQWEAEVILADRARAKEGTSRFAAFLDSIRNSAARTTNPSMEMEMLTYEWSPFM